jgi:hypothetical protein
LPEVAASAVVVSTCNLFTGVVVPIPVWAMPEKHKNKNETKKYSEFLIATYYLILV